MVPSAFAQERTAEAAARYPLIPWPQHLEARAGQFTLNDSTRIVLSDPQNEEAGQVAAAFALLLRDAAALPMRMIEAPATGAAENAITFDLSDAMADSAAGEGAYQLDITPSGAVVTAATPRGLFYGMQTLRQLLPPAVEQGMGDRRPDWSIPAVYVEDAPRFGYRGMHLDVGRHYMPVAFIKKYIDLLALYKFNRFHWHLTEDQGWRIEIKKYPRLTEIGACRDSSMVGRYAEQRYDDARYCGFYTQEEAREIVVYAEARFVTVIPEIEMPGHSRAALAAYPELGCTDVMGDTSYTVATTWGIHEEIYCPKEETFTFLEDVLTEVMAIFPSEYIHIGGDEAPKDHWGRSATAQAVIEREGLADEHELQSYFIRRIEEFLNANGRKLIGWDEILEGGLAPEATVMSWRGEEGGIAAAQQGHDAIMTPGHSLYFDHYQSDPENEPVAIGGMTTLEDTYAYEPVPDTLTAEEARHILGAQGNVWTEYMNSPEKVEYMVFPRMLALSEVVWSPKAARDWARFTERLPAHLRRLDVLDVNYRRPEEVPAQREGGG